jgi:hypothetical protein
LLLLLLLLLALLLTLGGPETTGAPEGGTKGAAVGFKRSSPGLLPLLPPGTSFSIKKKFHFHLLFIKLLPAL